MPPVTSLFTRSLGQSKGDAVNICITQNTPGVAYGVQLSIVEGSTLRDRVYRVNVKSSGNPEGWRRLVPVDSTESGTTWAVDVLVQPQNQTATFRVVRTQLFTETSTLTSKVKAYSAIGGAVQITGSATSSAGAVNEGVYEGSLLTKVDGKTGVNTDVPGETLDVVGSFRVSGNTALPGLSKSTTGNAVYIDAATGLLTYGEIVSNGIDAGNVYTRAELDGGQLDSRYYTETEVNALVGAKENAISASTTSTYFRGDKTFVTLNTASVAESTSNLYFTDARAQSALVTQLSTKANVTNAAISGTLSVTGNASIGNVSTNAISGTTLTLTGNAQTGNTVTVGASEVWNASNQNEKWRLIVNQDATGNFFQIESLVSSQWQPYLRIDK